MSLTIFISKKFISAKGEAGFLSFFSAFALLGISIGVTILIIALSVINGFEKIISQKLIDLDSHIQIIGFGDKPLSFEKENLNRIQALIPNNIKTIQPYISRIALISRKKIKEGITIKGIKSDYFSHSKKITLVEGSFDISENNAKSIIIGRTLANKLLIKTGEKVTLFALKNNNIPSPENLPNIEQFYVTGIFESGISKYDDNYAYINITSAQNLFDMKDMISGYEIKLNNIEKIDCLAEVLQSNLRYPHYVRTIFQLYRNIFTWIELQKKPIPIVLALIILVAVVNIISTLLMLVLEKLNSIGILKSIGAKKSQINRIFLFQGIFLGIIGISLGNLFAFGLSKIQLKYNIITLPSNVYFTSEVPLLIDSNVYLLVSLVTFILCVLASLLPSYIGSKINPVTTLRFN